MLIMVADTELELENERAPLAPAEKSSSNNNNNSNGAVSKKPRNREVSSRYKTAVPAAPSRRFPSPDLGRVADAAASATVVWQDLGNRIRRLSDVNQLRSSMPERDLLAGSKMLVADAHLELENGRIPLAPAEKSSSNGNNSNSNSNNNATNNNNNSTAASRKPRNREVSSRYKAALQMAPSRRFPSPNLGREGEAETMAPARFWQELGNRIRLSDENQLRSSMPDGDLLTGSKTIRRSKGNSAPSSTVNTPANVGRWTFSPVRAPPTAQPPSSPSATFKVSSPSRALPSPTRTRPQTGGSHQGIRASSVACMLNFGVDTTKGKKAMSQQEEAQYLRILHNRWLQWRFVNARAESAFNSQKTVAERTLNAASLQISDLQKRVAEKRIKLQQARQAEKLHSLIAAHGKFLEEWEKLEPEHSFALSGAIEALEAATLRVPVTGISKVDMHALQDAFISASNALEPLELTAQNLLEMTEETSEAVCQLAQVSKQEKALLQECGDVLERVATLEIEERSLRSYILQLEKEKNRMSPPSAK